MPYIIGLIGIIATAYLWAMRARAAASVTYELADMANDVLAAARRFGFRRRYDTHPVDSADEPNLMIGGLAIAFLELGGLPSLEQQNGAIAAAGRHLQLDLDASRELVILGRWLMNECKGAQPAIARMSRRLLKLGGSKALFPLMAVLNDIGQSREGGLSLQQREALEEIARIFKLA